MRSLLSLAAWSSVFTALATASPTVLPRATSTSVGQLWAYGTNITGLPIFYNNGVAFVGNSSLATSTATDLNFTLTSTTLKASPLSSSNSTIGTPILAIDTATDAFKPVVLVNSTSDLTSGYTSTGFILFGTQLAWKSSEGILKANFIAVPSSDVEGLWTLEWNQGSTITDDNEGVLVNIKNVAPTTLTE